MAFEMPPIHYPILANKMSEKTKEAMLRHRKVVRRREQIKSDHSFFDTFGGLHLPADILNEYRKFSDEQFKGRLPK